CAVSCAASRRCGASRDLERYEGKRGSALTDARGGLAMAPEVFDVTILGGGPVGLYGAYYAGFRRLRTKVVESLEALGGQVTALYPEKWIFDVAGFPKVLGRVLVNNLTEQAMQYQPALCLGETVGSLTTQPDGTIQMSSDRNVHLT